MVCEKRGSSIRVESQNRAGDYEENSSTKFYTNIVDIDISTLRKIEIYTPYPSFNIGLEISYSNIFPNRETCLPPPNGQEKPAEKTVADEVRSLMKEMPCMLHLIGRDRSSQKVGVETDWVDPEINDLEQGDLEIKIISRSQEK
ncbi:hypothetical protein TNCV_4572111 [Trichonephila clavipes]|nr:hypothetical protein TNCV_4572111 [Trichonephila clavipes]